MGRGLRQDKNGKAQVIRATGRWSQEAEARFLGELAATANVRAAAAAAGFSTTAIYKRRAAWPGFSAAWDAALDQGYARIEALLIAGACDALSGAGAVAGAVAGEAPPSALVGEGPPLAAGMTVDQAMNLLRLHRASARGGAPQRYDARAKPTDLGAVRASILRKVAAIERVDARTAAGRGEAGTAE
ncbi:hypothetical protein PIB19_21115 [Sphingomonas sp. 7/4-4]|uniref:hypothetical protein n=1 Tax=Sphingomonas sp. 7/4-4 TaxID=3018446 RepID=UPI0022F3D756|nr:hypothetical protein [Sphingomonas sp. 7/4-4]WBY07753.1 hypothetical protein PIB19_21115 [Sphingomonas sp. 7/4-4]